MRRRESNNHVRQAVGVQVSACICAARYMVQSLREPSPLLLTLDEELPIPNGKRRGRSLLDGEASSFESASRR